MYTQTGRIGRKEGKIARKTKPRERERRGEPPKEPRPGDVLVPLTILNHPVYSPLVFPSSTATPFTSPPPASRVPPPASLLPTSPAPAPPLSLLSRVSLFCSSRTHRCGTSIVLKWFHLIAPLPRRPRYSLHGTLNGRDTRVSENFLCRSRAGDR